MCLCVDSNKKISPPEGQSPWFILNHDNGEKILVRVSGCPGSSSDPRHNHTQYIQRTKILLQLLIITIKSVQGDRIWWYLVQLKLAETECQCHLDFSAMVCQYIQQWGVSVSNCALKYTIITRNMRHDKTYNM